MAALSDGASVDLTVVVPYVNTGPRVRATVDELVAALARTGATFEVVAVSDGSTDGSERSLDGLDPAVVRTVRLPANAGKGEALRAGFSEARGRYVGFLDGDGDLPADQMATLAAVAGIGVGRDAAGAAGGGDAPDFVIGSKRHPGSEVVYPPLRRLGSWAWQLLVLGLFGLRIGDTQAGIKLIRRDVLAAVLPRTVEQRFAFDVELLAVAARLGYRRVVEVPVHIRARVGTTVSAGAALAMVRDLLAIYWRLNVTRRYDGPTEARPGVTDAAGPGDVAGPGDAGGPVAADPFQGSEPPSRPGLRERAVPDVSSGRDGRR